MEGETHRYTVAEAARVLGITETAVRARIQRGTLDSEREAGAVYVRLSGDDTTAKTHEQAELVEALRDQIATLQRQLDESNAANRENRRLLAALAQRIPPALEPPQETPPERPGASETASESEGRGETPPYEESRPWWQRWFGG